MTVEEIENSIGICGLVCALCSCKSNCSGCRSKVGDCSIKKCSSEKGFDYCFLCKEFPCDEAMFKNIRLKAFNLVAKEEGLTKLAEYLVRNDQNGIQYHRSDGLKGDYDRLQNEQEVISLLKDGRIDPYNVCPTYESKSFLLRLVSPDDAENLFKCYSNKDAQRLFNTDHFDLKYINIDSLERMQFIIKLWLDSYNNKNFVRFSIISKSTDFIVGTIEMFGGAYGILRIDIMPEYECEEYLSELLEIAEHFYNDFNCDRILSKAIPEATERIKALLENGYTPYPKNDTWNREHYFMKRKPT